MSDAYSAGAPSPDAGQEPEQEPEQAQDQEDQQAAADTSTNGAAAGAAGDAAKPVKTYEAVSDPAKLWPTPGTRWDSPKDLLLVMQLATLAAGYSATANLASRVTPTATAHAFIRCIENKTAQSSGCQSTLAVLQYSNAKNPHGTCRVQLPPKAGKTAKPSLKDHHSHEDSGHLKVAPAIPPNEPPMTLEVGPQIYTVADINKLEAYARADSRRDPVNAVITVVRSKDILFKCRGKRDDDACGWQIRLTPTSTGAKTYTCKEIEPDHTCDPAHYPPSPHLNSVLDYFPPLHLVRGLIGKSKLAQSRKIQKQQQAKQAPRKRAPVEISEDEDEDEEGVLSDHALSVLCEKLVTYCPPASTTVGPLAKRARSTTSHGSSDLSDAHSTGGDP